MANNGQGAAAADRERVEAAIAQLCEKGKGVAAFDADGVLWRGDSGVDFLLWQIENHRLTPHGERQATGLWEGWLRGKVDELEFAIIAAACLEGLREETVAADAAAFFARKLRQNINQPVAAWARRLQEAGVEVWVISGSTRWVVESGVRAMGLRADRTLPVCAEVRDGFLTSNVPEPVTWGAGKAEAIRQLVGRMPQFAIGNTGGDRHMLELAELAVAFEPDRELEELARARNWPIIRF